MKQATVILLLGALSLFVSGCGGGGGRSVPDTAQQDVQTQVDAGAVASILEVIGFQEMGTMVEIQCKVAKEADIVVEYPTADGPKTLEIHVAPPHAVILAPGYSKDAGGKIVIKPKE